MLGHAQGMDIISKGGFSKDEVKRFEKEVRDTYSSSCVVLV